MYYQYNIFFIFFLKINFVLVDHLKYFCIVISIFLSMIFVNMQNSVSVLMHAY